MLQKSAQSNALEISVYFITELLSEAHNSQHIEILKWLIAI